ncbi:MAG: hypothetical protein COA69_01810 [Robiginitomaculum sp.]|nr:MAG: hypothetical protein COA69_01810 [Robiginitomaculum sp.]
MNVFLRWGIGTVIAGFVTFSLFVMMMLLIKGDFKPEEKLDNASFEINPKVEDIKVAVRETKIAKIRKVVTPPPPPQIERQQAAQPNVAIASLEGAIPDFETPKLDRQSFKITVSDRDAQPLVRIPPIMPPRAEKSGHCTVRFSVSPEGQPYEVVVAYCSSSVFRRSSIKSVEKWKYQPKIVNGRSVARQGVETKITFNLSDERGNIIPE